MPSQGSLVEGLCLGLLGAGCAAAVYLAWGAPPVQRTETAPLPIEQQKLALPCAGYDLTETLARDDEVVAGRCKGDRGELVRGAITKDGRTRVSVIGGDTNAPRPTATPTPRFGNFTGGYP